jgi:hypothetical protein
MMTTRPYPPDVLDQAYAGLEAWKEISAGMSIGDLNQTVMQGNLDQVAEALTEIDSLEAQLIDWRNRRDDLLKETWGHVKRLRAGMKAIYGDDSSQYEMVGGKRLSDRKPHRRKNAAG